MGRREDDNFYPSLLLSSGNKQPEIANVGNSCLILGLYILKSKTYLKVMF